METEEIMREPTLFPDEESGSAYEISENEGEFSPDESPIRSRGTSTRRPESRASLAQTTISRSHSRANSLRDKEPSLSPGAKERLDVQIREEAIQWASTFQEPQSPSQIRTPPRRSSVSRKRKPRTAPVEVKSKRLRVYWSNEYRELLNNDILDIVTATSAKTLPSLPTSQIGASIWTSEEKNALFNSLARLGKGNVRGIAEQIRTKSILETDEYLRLLHQGSLAKPAKSEANLWLEMPTAIEVSGECSEILERAGQSLASRQDQFEKTTEESKWGAAWLIDETVSHRLGKHNPEGEKATAFDEVLPAANLFNLKNWLELSSKIFMNPAEPYEEDNWRNLADIDESPAIRATAFEDFHSLAVSVTKRLISTTLFCTMSRQRAMASKNVKQSDVNTDDVGAAVKILGMKPDSHEFWQNCARRSKLQIVDEDEDEFMTYEDVEEEMRERRRRSSRSRSRSRSHSVHSRLPEPEHSPTTSSASDVSIRDLEEDIPIPTQERNLGDESDSDTTTYQESTTIRSLARQEAEKKQDSFINECDKEASKAAELKLWNLLEQEPPLELNLDEMYEPMTFSTAQRKGERDDHGNWRENVEYWSSWELFDKPVPGENFERNRTKISKRARRIAEEGEEESSDEEEAEILRHGESEEEDGSSPEAEESDVPVNREEDTGDEQPADHKDADQDMEDETSSQHESEQDVQADEPEIAEERAQPSDSDSADSRSSPHRQVSPFEHRAQPQPHSSSLPPEDSLQYSIEGEDVEIKSEEE